MNKKDIKDIITVLESIPETKETKRLLKKLNNETISIKPRSAKNKGASFQKEVRNLISEITGIPWGTGDEALIASRTMGLSGTDLILRGEAKELFNFAVECKNTETLSLWKTVEQAKNNLGDFKYWIICHKKNQHKPIVILDMNDFFQIYKTTIKQKGENENDKT